MINKIFFSYLILFTLSTQSWSADHLLYFAAGDPTPSFHFETDLNNMGHYIRQNRGLQANVAISGGNPQTQAVVNQSFSGVANKTDFRDSDYPRLIQSYIRKLENGEIVRGDQLMVYFNSHGGEQEGKSHKIQTGEGSWVSLDELDKLKKLAAQKGVKMAIIDASCHSGSSQALADENTCVISSTGAQHYGYPSFSRLFSERMKKGKNLEEIFLEARAQDDSPAIPMISTQAGQSVKALIYDNITPYLYKFEEDGKLSPYLFNNNSLEKQCLADQQFEALIKTINSIEEINSVTTKFFWKVIKTKEIDLTNLKELLFKYKKYQDLVKFKMRELGDAGLKAEEQFNISVNVGGSSATLDHKYTVKELLTSDFKKLIINKQAQIDAETNSSKRAQYEASKALYVQAQAKAVSLLRVQPNLGRAQQTEAEINALIELNYDASLLIAKEERKLYSALYKNSLKNPQSTKPNACQNFKL